MKKRDMATTLGLTLGAACIIIGMLLDGSTIKPKQLILFWDLPSVFITLGGSFFTILICYPMKVIKKLPSILKNAFFDKEMSQADIIEKFVDLSKKARKEGLLSLEDEVETINDSFFKHGIQMVVDGMEPETIREVLEMEISSMERRHSSGINLLKSWAGYGPAYGMLGTLIGLTQMLASINDPSTLGPGMAKAIITSFYGSVLANFLFGPLADKLECKTDEESEIMEMMLEGIISIQAGVNPRVIEDKLKTYLPPEERLKLVSSESDRSAVLENE
jgi:chemotaxis protein MotA